MSDFDWCRWERKMRWIRAGQYLMSALWVGVAVVYLGIALGWWARP